MSNQEKAVESARKIWAPLIDEINSLVEALCVLDKDETKYVDILAKHVERIQNTIPPQTLHIRYPKPMHKLLSVQPGTSRYSEGFIVRRFNIPKFDSIALSFYRPKLL